MKPFAALVAAAGLLLLAADKADDPSTKDLDKLQGTWTVVSGQGAGKDVPTNLLAVDGIAFDRGTYTNIVQGRPTTSGAFRLDSSKQPPTIDLVSPDNKTVTQGIFQLDGDTLKMAFASVDENRPVTLDSKPGSNVIVLRLKREKK